MAAELLLLPFLPSLSRPSLATLFLFHQASPDGGFALLLALSSGLMVQAVEDSTMRGGVEDEEEEDEEDLLRSWEMTPLSDEEEEVAQGSV